MIDEGLDEATTPISRMNLEEIWKKIDRNNRIMNLCFGIPIIYEGNVPLSEEMKKDYSGNFGNVLREMVADNIRLADITNCFNNVFNTMWGSSKPDQQLTENDIKGYIDKMIKGR